ncbi:conserved hypothetical protein TIGR00296 [Thermoplasmatales archaeon BRNA1]|nr:conserved hypothetical protein TIGR00296 [Thermoplasmatales archaeon BRNA1]
MIPLEVGERAIGIAREAAYAESENSGYVLPKDLGGEFSVNSGAFVTVSEFPSRRLRACIGYPEPIMPLGESVMMSARGAVHDPRFPKLTREEAEACTFEVTVLTKPEPLEYTDVPDLMSRIVIGRDGLIVEYGPYRALFLPQVPVEQGWGVEEYISELCYKAGMRPDAWRNNRLTFETFRGEIFSEIEPRGKVERRE